MLNDIRYAVRTLCKSPGFTSAAILTLALGIGATTAIFSLLDAMLLRVVAFPGADRTVVLSGITAPPATPVLEHFAQARTIRDLAEYQVGRATIDTGDATQVITVAKVTPSLFPLVSATPLAGSLLTDASGTVPSVVLSERLARAILDNPDAALGKSVLIAGARLAIVGVMPREFHLPWRTEAWVTLPSDESRHELALAPVLARSALDSATIARLRDGISLKEALAEVRVLQRQAENAFQSANPQRRMGRSTVSVRFLRDAIVHRHALLLKLLSVSALVVLLIACVNVANLLLVRSVSRREELAIRACLGATRARLGRQLLAESLVLGVPSVAVGVLIAAPLIFVAKVLGPAEAEGLASASVDLRALGYAAVAGLVVTLLTGLLPAYRGARAHRVKPKGHPQTLPDRRLQQAGVALQIGLSLVLLVGAALLTKSLTRLLRVDPGFDAADVTVVEVLLPDAASIEEQQRRMASVLERVSELPGVRAAAWTDHAPLSPTSAGLNWVDPGIPKDPPGGVFHVRTVTPDYFDVLHIPILNGRVFDEAEFSGRRHVAVVSDDLARRFWPERSAIGRPIYIGDRKHAHEVVGVVARVTQDTLDESNAQVYLPGAEAFSDLGMLLVRTVPGAGSPYGAVSEAVHDADPTTAVASSTPMEALVSGSSRNQRFRTSLVVAFAILALGLAASGLYGTVAWIARRRSHELGVRLALGATRGQLTRLVLRQAATTITLGVAAGLAAAYASASAIRGLLFGVAPYDPAMFVAAAAAMIGVAMLTTYVPARRAARVDPVRSLKVE